MAGLTIAVQDAESAIRNSEFAYEVLEGMKRKNALQTVSVSDPPVASI
jgi:hypothetical protein